MSLHQTVKVLVKRRILIGYLSAVTFRTTCMNGWRYSKGFKLLSWRMQILFPFPDAAVKKLKLLSFSKSGITIDPLSVLLIKTSFIQEVFRFLDFLCQIHKTKKTRSFQTRRDDTAQMFIIEDWRERTATGLSG